MKSEKCKFGRAIIATVVILVVLVFVFAAGSASAAKTWYVDDDGGQDFTRIQAAVVATSDGDIIYANATIHALERDSVAFDKAQIEAYLNSRNARRFEQEHDFVQEEVNNSAAEHLGDFSAHLSSNTIFVPDNYPRIQAAIDAASAGDTIIVRDGIYHENVVVNKPYLMIRSQNGSANCIVNASVNTSAVFRVTADYVNISGFTVQNAVAWWVEGICLSYVEHCNISNNNIFNNEDGIYLFSSNNNTFTNNTMSSNGWSGISLSHSNNNTLTNNNASSNDWKGIGLWYSNNSILTNNIALNNSVCGIWVNDYSNNTILTNNIAFNNSYGIWIDSSNNIVTDNILNSNSDDGILLWSSSGNNTITGNIAFNNSYGIWLSSSNGSIITNNNIPNNRNYGILFFDSSNNNIVTDNNISNNDWYGIKLYSSNHNNIFYHNNFLDNTVNAYDATSTNAWDNGSVDGGNYWSDHVCTGDPSNGSQPYIIPPYGHKDRYPFENISGWTPIPAPTGSFDTGSGGYPSIMGNHTGTIKPNHTVIATKMYTYPCSGTGGHTEYVKIWNSTWNVTAIWDGYVGDWHNISFSEPFTLKEGIKYNYTIITGSYPQIHHTDRLEIDDGEITCAAFIDANGKRYNNWIPAIRLE